MNHIRLEKKGLRGLAIAESFRVNDSKSTLAGVIMRRDFVIDGFAFGQATLRGDDATTSIIKMYESLNRQDVSFLILSGLIISMYNIIDIKKLHDEIGIPIIAVTYKESVGLDAAIKHHFPGSHESKISQYAKLEPRTEIILHTGNVIFIRTEGCPIKDAEKLLNSLTLQGAIPEPLRVAQLLAYSVLRSKS